VHSVSDKRGRKDADSRIWRRIARVQKTRQKTNSLRLLMILRGDLFFSSTLAKNKALIGMRSKYTLRIRVANMSAEYEKKKEILKDLILREEDVLAQLQRIVKLAKPFLRIEEKTGRVVLSDDFQFANSEKIFLFLLGKYLAFHSGITKEAIASMSALSDGISVVRTTLPAPLKRLLDSHIVERPEKDTYRINPHKIESTLQDIRQKHNISEEETTAKKSNSSNPFPETFGKGTSFDDLFGKK